MIKLVDITEKQFQLLQSALYVAAQVYASDARTEGMTDRLVEQFKRQEKEAKELVELLVNTAIDV